MDMKKIGIYIGAVIFIIGGYYLYSSRTPANAPSVPEQKQSANIFVPADANMALRTATDSNLGAYLVASNGMTLYLYTRDTPGTSVCYEQCAVNWPPYIVSSAAPLKAEASIMGKIGTTTRTDGSMQITYNGTPLYYWIKDAKPGDTTGQGVGGIWYVVKP